MWYFDEPKKFPYRKASSPDGGEIDREVTVEVDAVVVPSLVKLPTIRVDERDKIDLGGVKDFCDCLVSGIIDKEVFCKIQTCLSALPLVAMDTAGKKAYIFCTRVRFVRDSEAPNVTVVHTFSDCVDGDKLRIVCLIGGKR